MLQHPELYTSTHTELPHTDKLIEANQQVLKKLLQHLSTNSSCNTATLVELFRDTPLFDAINKLAAWNHQVPTTALDAEFIETVQFLTKQTEAREVEQLIEKARHQAWGDTRPVVIAASTHDGEEEQVLSVLAKLQIAVPNVVLLIAPRHSERFEMVYKLAKTHQFKTGRRSQETSIEPDTEVVVLDSLGELLGFYDLSDYAFVGGSLVSIGGHNVLEPIALEVPVFCGMFMQNSKSLCEELMQARAMQQVSDAMALVEAIGVLHHNKDVRDGQIERATNALKASQGAVARHVDAIASYWD